MINNGSQDEAVRINYIKAEDEEHENSNAYSRLREIELSVL